MGHKIHICPQEITIDIVENKTLLEIFQDNNIYVKSSCGGFARCRDCLIKIIRGEENLNDPTFEEKQLLGNVFHMTKERLACQTKASATISVDLSEHNSNDQDPSPRKNFRVKKKDIIEKEKNIKEELQRDKYGKQGGYKRPRPFYTDYSMEPQFGLFFF